MDGGAPGWSCCRVEVPVTWPPPTQIPSCGFPAMGSCRRSDVTKCDEGLECRPSTSVRMWATSLACWFRYCARSMCRNPHFPRPRPFPPRPPPPLITVLFGRFIGTTSASDSSPVSRPLRLLGLHKLRSFAAQYPTPHNCCVRFAVVVAFHPATLATGRLLHLTRVGLPPTGPCQLSWRTEITALVGCTFRAYPSDTIG